MAKRLKVITMAGSHGVNFQVCECHYDLVRDHKWHVLRNGHVARSVWYPEVKKKKMVYIHRLIANAPEGINIDHRDTDPQNNCCWNLRFCNQEQNTANASMWRHNTSGVRGVAWHKQMNKWRAYITINGKQKSLGLFDSIDEATKARRKIALEQWGEFSRG